MNVALLGTTVTPGNIGIQIEKTNHKTVAITNSGSVIATTPNVFIALPMRLRGKRPISKPATIAVGNAIRAATKASIAVLRIRGKTICATCSSRLIE